MIEIIKNNKDIFEATNGVSSLLFYKNGENRGKYKIRFKNNELTECIIKDCYSAINIYSPNKKKLIEKRKQCEIKNYSRSKLVYYYLGGINTTFPHFLGLLFIKSKPFSNSESLSL